MTEAQAIEAIKAHFATEWPILHPAASSALKVPFTFRNESGFDTSDLGDLGAWIRLTVMPTTREQVTMGSAPSRKFESRGNVFVNVFCAVNHIASDGSVVDGETTLAALVEEIRKVLEGVSLSGVHLYAAAAPRFDEDAVWNGATIAIPYRLTDTR